MLRTFALGLVFLGLLAAEARSTVVISNDPGGQIGAYINKYEWIRTTGETVTIDGKCASACTIVLGAVPHDKICVTPRAQLGFHQAYNKGWASSGQEVRAASKEASDLLMTIYPQHIKRWIRDQGGLPGPDKMKWLKGKQLQAMYKPCRIDANARF